VSLIRIIISIALLFCLSGCKKDVWTADELQRWYSPLKQGNPSFVSPLYYRGTDNNYHYFICRSMDDFVNIKVIKEEIRLDDIKPAISISSKPFPGYYAVDPNNGYKRVDEAKFK
jgi:hypothetical protein